MSEPVNVLQYPIGKFAPSESYSDTERQEFINRIETLPARLEAALRGLTDTQLDTPYRDGGWTVRQVAHHVADSHMNAYIRLKWTLTEDTPTIKAYDEKGWAKTPETSAPPELSLALLKALHAKWVLIFKGLSPAERARQFYHPDSKKHIRAEALMGLYAWHGDHHLAHITTLKERMKW